MKNTIRVRKNPSASRRGLQQKTGDKSGGAVPHGGTKLAHEGFELPPDAPHHACLCIFDKDYQEPANKVPLTETEFAHLMQLGVSGPVRSGDIIAAAVREKLSPNPEIIRALSENEHASMASNALLTLLVERQRYTGQRTDYQAALSLAVEPSTQIAEGLHQLSLAVQQRLTASMQAVDAILFPHHEVAK